MRIPPSDYQYTLRNSHILHFNRYGYAAVAMMVSEGVAFCSSMIPVTKLFQPPGLSAEIARECNMRSQYLNSVYQLRGARPTARDSIPWWLRDRDRRD